MDRIDEAARRLPGFKEGTPVEGADGQFWNLPRPVVIFDIDETENGFTSRMDLDGDDGLSKLMKERGRLLEAYYAAAAGEKDPDGLILTDLKIRSLLVKRNYDLTPAETNAVLPFTYDTDQPLHRIRNEVLAVASGDGPKPVGGGDESPPTPRE